MGYSVEWLIENEIVYAKFWGTGDANELRLALTEIAEMRQKSPRDSIHTITDTNEVTSTVPFQDSMKIIKEFKTANDDSWEIVVGKLDRVLQLSLSISRSILRNKSMNVKTLEDALTLLKKEDKTLSWDNLNNELIENFPQV